METKSLFPSILYIRAYLVVLVGEAVFILYILIGCDRQVVLYGASELVLTETTSILVQKLWNKHGEVASMEQRRLPEPSVVIIFTMV